MRSTARAGWRLSALVVAVAALQLDVPSASASMQETPRRVVSLVPAATQVLDAIGALDRLVGVSSYDDWPPAVAALPRVGALLDPNLEVILALRPDLVITDPAQAGLVRQLQLAGIESYPYGTEDIAGVLVHIEALGRRLGVEAAGREAAERLTTALDQVRSAAAERAPVATMLVFGRRPGTFADLWVNGGVGFLHELMEIAGADNIYGDVDRQSVRAGIETVLARVPELVIELRLGADPETIDPEAIAAHWRSLAGFERVRVRVLTDSWLVIPGPRLADAVRQFDAAVRR